MYENYPRVTSVLQLLHNQKLMEWSNFLGRVCRTDYNTFMEESQDIGTYVHNKIERNINEITGERYIFRDSNDNISINPKLMRKIDNAYYGYELFKTRMNEMNVSITSVDTEVSLVSHKYKFRGTCDWLCYLNNELFLIDFKSSNEVYPKMFMQLSAYNQMLNEKGIYPKRCGILSLDKKKRNSFKFVHVESEYLEMNVLPIFIKLVGIHDDWNDYKKGWDELCQTKFETTTW